MGRMLGAFDPDDQLDRPDLNKCPDCGCYFDGEACPLCGKICPENMRAGNRKPVKTKKRKSSSGRVTFVEWYHSWWCIVLALLFFWPAGLVLLITSPHKKWKKVLFVVGGVCYGIVSTFGLGNLLGGIAGLWEKPVDTKLSRDEYVAACETMSAEDYYRLSEQYTEKFVSVNVTVKAKITDADGRYGQKYTTYYLCTNEEQTVELLIRDCLLDNPQAFLSGDTLVVWGEGAGSHMLFDTDGTYYEAPCIHAAYAERLPVES